MQNEDNLLTVVGKKKRIRKKKKSQLQQASSVSFWVNLVKSGKITAPENNVQDTVNTANVPQEPVKPISQMHKNWMNFQKQLNPDLNQDFSEDVELEMIVNNGEVVESKLNKDKPIMTQSTASDKQEVLQGSAINIKLLLKNDTNSTTTTQQPQTKVEPGIRPNIITINTNTNVATSQTKNTAISTTSNINANSNTTIISNTNSNANTTTNSNANTYTNSNANTNTNSNANTYTNSNANTNTKSNANINPNSNANTITNANININTNSNANYNTNSNAYPTMNTNIRQNLTIVSTKPIPTLEEQRQTRPIKLNKTGPTTPEKSNITYYPKGIPKSFLMETEMMQMEQKDDSQPWATYIPPAFDANPPVFQPIPASQMYSQIEPTFGTNIPPFVQTEPQGLAQPQAYSPSDIYDTSVSQEDIEAELGSPDTIISGQKRISAFQRLGPVQEPKKPKLTINLLLNEKQSVREVVDETPKKPKVKQFVPIHMRPEMVNSTDDIVTKYLTWWPWKKTVNLKRTVTARKSRSVMIMEQEQMEEFYENDFAYFQVSVTGYPPSWKKEDVLDALLDALKGITFIPCFILFTNNECKFLVTRCRIALVVFHKFNFIVRKGDVCLTISISQTDLTIRHLDFIPKLVLKKRLSSVYDLECRLDLSEFTLKEDVSHFIYFPLNRTINQAEIIKLQSGVSWEHLTELILSRNKITCIAGFDLNTVCPKLRELDLSHNLLERVTVMLPYRELSLQSLKLDGNPLCYEYTDPALYVRVLKMMFPSLKEIDGVRIKPGGELPTSIKNFCPEDAKNVAEKFLETFFPLLDSSEDQRELLKELYSENAVLTITYNQRLSTNSDYRYLRTIFNRCRNILQQDMESIQGSTNITKIIRKWPPQEHDPFSFTVDVMYHDEFATIVRIGGILKLTAQSLADDEHLLAFTRTVVLRTSDGAEYKIHNEMLYWDEPAPEYSKTAFQVLSIRPKHLSLKFEKEPDDDFKEKLISIFMKLTEMEKMVCKKCLELTDWNFRNGLELFAKHLRLDNLNALMDTK